VVDIGVPVDITAPSFESTIANLNGGWTHIRSSLQSKLALAQAQSNYDATAARIGALLDAQTAGICDEKCTSLLASLQAQLPRQRANISALESTVQRDDAAAAFPLPAPIAQMTRIVENVLQTQNASQSPIVQYPNYDNVLYPNTQNGGIHGSVQGTPVANSQNPSLPPASDTLGVQVNTSPSETSGTTSDENPILHIIHEVWNFLTRLFASHS
jgi:hypothetical protein